MKVKIKDFLLLNLYYSGLVIILCILGFSIRIPWSVTAFGIVDAFDRSFVRPKVEGTIAEIFVEEGQFVKNGQKLARIESPTSETSKASVLAAVELAKTRYEQAEEMFSKGFISYNELHEFQKDYEVKEVSVKETNNYEIISPADGVVLATDELKFRLGENVLAGTIFATIAQMDKMIMKLSVPDYLISKVKEGQEVRCYMVAFPSTAFGTIKGKVTKVLPQAIVSDKGISFVVIASMENPYMEKMGKKIFLKPGMSAQTKIIYERSSFFEHIIFRGSMFFIAKSSHLNFIV